MNTKKSYYVKKEIDIEKEHPPYIRLGRLIREHRNKRNIPLRQIYNEVGIQPQALSKAEKGFKSCSIYNLRYAALRVGISERLFREAWLEGVVIEALRKLKKETKQ